MLFSLKNTVFTVFSGIKQIPVVAGWYYQMHCFFNGETQVGTVCKKPQRYTMLPNYSNKSLHLYKK